MLIRKLFVPLLLCVLTACGGGGSSSPAMPPRTVDADGDDGKIEFVSDRTGLLTQAGQSHEFKVQVLDNNGTPISGASVDWELDDDSGLLLEVTGPLSARVTALNWSLGSRMLSASSASVTGIAQGQVLMAVLQSNAFLFDDDLLLSADRVAVSNVATVVLAKTAATESLQVGDILLIGRLTPIQDEILSVSVGADTVTLSSQPASLRQVFAELDYFWIGEGETFRGYQPSAQSQSSTKGLVGASLASANDEPACEVGGEIVPIKSVSGSLPINQITPSLKIHIRFTRFGDTEDYVSIVARFAGSIEQPPWELVLGGSLVGTLECRFDLPRFVTPPLAELAKLPLRLGFQPRTGFTGAVSLSQELTVTGPSGTLTGYSDFGLVYANNTWTPFEVSQWDTVQSSDFQLNEIPGATLGVKIAPFLSMDTQLIVGGNPLPSAGIPVNTLAELDFLEFKAALPADLSIQQPFSPTDRNYTGPRWTMAATLEANLKAALSGGAAETLLKLLGVSTSIPGELVLLPEVTLKQFRSPVIELQADCTEPCRVEPGTEVFVQADTGHKGEAELSLMAADGDDPTVQLLDQWPTLLGKASFNIMPAPDGRTRTLLPRLRTNEFTQLLPYAELASPVVIATQQGGITPVSHEIHAVALSRGEVGSTFCPYSSDYADEERHELTVVEFNGAVNRTAAASHNAQGSNGQILSDVMSSLVEGDNIVMTINTSTSGNASASTFANDVGGECRYQTTIGASASSIRKFIVTAPMIYQIEASCTAASSVPSDEINGQVSIDIVDGQQTARLYKYTCGAAGANGSPSGNGILFPGTEVQFGVSSGNGIVAYNSADSVSAAVSVTLTLSPQ